MTVQSHGRFWQHPAKEQSPWCSDSAWKNDMQHLAKHYLLGKSWPLWMEDPDPEPIVFPWPNYPLASWPHWFEDSFLFAIPLSQSVWSLSRPEGPWNIVVLFESSFSDNIFTYPSLQDTKFLPLVTHKQYLFRRSFQRELVLNFLRMYPRNSRDCESVKSDLRDAHGFLTTVNFRTSTSAFGSFSKYSTKISVFPGQLCLLHGKALWTHLACYQINFHWAWSYVHQGQ